MVKWKYGSYFLLFGIKKITKNVEKNKQTKLHLCVNIYFVYLYENLVQSVTINPEVHRGRDRMVVGITTISVQSVFITSKVVSSNPIHDVVYSTRTLCDKVCE